MCVCENRQRVLVVLVEEELVVGGSGESHKGSKLESRQKGGVFVCVCVLCVCVCVCVCVCEWERGGCSQEFLGVGRRGGLILQAFTTDRALNTGSQMQPRLNPLKTTIILTPLHTHQHKHTHTHTQNTTSTVWASSSSPVAVNLHFLANPLALHLPSHHQPLPQPATVRLW